MNVMADDSPVIGLRTASPAEATLIADLVNRAYMVEQAFVFGERTSVDAVNALMKEPDAEFLVADHPESPAALAAAVFVRVRDERGYFGPFAVDPALQGKGIGKRVVRAVEAHCRAHHCRHLDLDVLSFRDELVRFYTSLGFVVSGTSEYAKQQRLRVPAHLVLLTKLL